MLSPALEKQRHQLYEKAVDSMQHHLHEVDNPAAMFAALRWGMSELDRTFEQTPAKVKATVACRAGCDFCCSVPVHVQAHEVFLAAEYIQVNFPPAELATVIERTSAHRHRLSGLQLDERGRLREPCALLHDGRCSIYTDRPEACRSHHTSNAEICRDDLTLPDVAIEKVYIPALRARMYAVMLGLDAAIESAGFDDRAYDFGSALYEALTNSLCRVLWLRHRPAFSNSCLAEPEDAFSPGAR
ncbi:MAG TPA: YkgJ family cysteine cluster protein [Lacunisphaera sp.]|jgi:Fe-S-cluster containining protein